MRRTRLPTYRTMKNVLDDRASSSGRTPCEFTYRDRWRENTKNQCNVGRKTRCITDFSSPPPPRKMCTLKKERNEGKRVRFYSPIFGTFLSWFPSTESWNRKKRRGGLSGAVFFLFLFSMNVFHICVNASIANEKWIEKVFDGTQRFY